MLHHKVLIIDDDDMLLEILKEAYLHEGFQVELCSDSEHALASVRQFRPDLIILDIYMPGLNGHNIISKLKSKKEFETIPVIFLSSSKNDLDIMQSMSAGASDYLNKPVDPAVLISKSKELLSCNTHRILLADDDPIICSIVENHLSHLGFKVDIEGDGHEIFKKAKKLKPDLILLDRLLPGRQGLVILEDLKKCPETMHIPVIIISVKTQEWEILEALKQGADDYIGKPIKIDELTFRIQRILKIG